MADRIIAEHRFEKNFCLSYTFYLSGHVIKQNSCYWSCKNPHIFREGNSQYLQKIIVWAGTFKYDIIIFLHKNWRNICCHAEEVFRTSDSSWIRELETRKFIFEKNLLLLLHLQQDGSRPHYIVPVVWKTRPIKSLPRFSDLTPQIYFLWGQLESDVFLNATWISKVTTSKNYSKIMGYSNSLKIGSIIKKFQKDFFNLPKTTRGTTENNFFKKFKIRYHK